MTHEERLKRNEYFESIKNRIDDHIYDIERHMDRQNISIDIQRATYAELMTAKSTALLALATVGGLLHEQ